MHLFPEEGVGKGLVYNAIYCRGGKDKIIFQFCLLIGHIEAPKPYCVLLEETVQSC